MVRTGRIALLCVAVALNGCYVSPKPQVVARMWPGHRPELSKVEFDGEYRLFTATVGKWGFLQPGGEPISQLKLVRGQRLGFERDDKGGAAAIGGDTRVAVDGNGSYAWEMRAVPGQVDRKKTFLLTIVTVGVIIGIVAGTAAAATSGSFGMVTL